MPNEKLPIEDYANTNEGTADSTVPVPPTRPTLPPAVALAFVIIALLGVLIVMGIKNGSFGSSGDSADITALKAEANALRGEYNNQRIAMGLRPIEGGSEPLEDVANRMKKDADTLVILAGSYQKLLTEKDIELSARNAEILRSEKVRVALSAENARIQSDLQRALVKGSDFEMIRRDLTDVKAQRDALAAELEETKNKMLGMSAGVSPDELDDLKRRLEETLRAKEFFESRVKDLEADLTKARLFASSENELLPAAVGKNQWGDRKDRSALTPPTTLEN